MVIFGTIVIQCCILGALMKPIPLTKRTKIMQVKKVFN